MHQYDIEGNIKGHSLAKSKQKHSPAENLLPALCWFTAGFDNAKVESPSLKVEMMLYLLQHYSHLHLRCLE